MAHEITNTKRGTSIIRVVDAGTTTIALNNLRAFPTNEVVASADIKRVTWATNGSISIVRNGVPQLSLHNAGEMRFDDFSHSIANNNTQDIVITIASGGSIVMELSKIANYNVDVYAS